MADIPRLNGVIRALEAGKTAFTSFCQADPDTAIAMATAKYDGIVYEMEHNPWDIRALRDSLQYMLNRGQIAKSGSLAPSVTPMVRIPPNGAEKAQFQAKQALDLGVYGIVWPHISSVEEAYNAVAACRYPRLKSAPLYEPAGTDMRFFDVQKDPPRNGRPTKLLDYGEFLDAVYREYLWRNEADFKWAEGEEEPLEVEEFPSDDDEET